MSTHFQFKINLQHVLPSPWRRFVLPLHASFADLHQAIQDACEWEGYHLFMFFEGRGSFVQLAEGVHEEADPDWAALRLDAWFGVGAGKRDSCLYVYDLGDDWHHHIELEGIVEHDNPRDRALLGGELSFPREDCGGAPGYQRSIEIASKLASGAAMEEWDAEFGEWLDGWTSAGFDLASAARNFSLSAGLEFDLAEAADRRKARPKAVALDRLLAAANEARKLGGLSAIKVATIRHLVCAASLHKDAPEFDTAFECKHPGCGLTLAAQWTGGVVTWRCPFCEDYGSVEGCEESSCDLSQSAKPTHKDEESVTLTLSRLVHETLLHIQNRHIESVGDLYLGCLEDGDVQIESSLRVFESLHAELERELQVAHAKATLKRLGEAQAAIEAHLSMRRFNLRTLGDRVNSIVGGLRLCPEDYEEILQQARRFVPTAIYDVVSIPDADRAALRHEATRLQVRRRILTVLGYTGVTYRESDYYSQLLEFVDEDIDRIAFGDPVAGNELARELLIGLAKNAPEIEDGDHGLQMTMPMLIDSIFKRIHEHAEAKPQLRPFLEELLQIWSEDECCFFGGLTKQLPKYTKLKKDRKWLIAKVKASLGQPAHTEHHAQELRDLIEALA